MLKTKIRSVGFSVLLALLAAGCAPPGVRALLDGKRLLDRGQPEAAVTRLEAAASLLRTNALAWSYLGLAHHQAGQIASATNAYQQALKFDRDLLDVHFNLGVALLDANRPDLAKLELTTYILRQPKAVDAWLKLGTAQWRLRETAAAEKSFSEVLRLQPNHPGALNGLGLVQMQRNRPRDAVPYFSAAVKQPPGYAPALRNLAVVSQLLNNREFALDKYREYAALQPRPADADAVLALARQLEQELAPLPARPPATNGFAQTVTVTNPPKPAVTNPVVAAPTRPPAPKTEPAPEQTHPKTSATAVTANVAPPPPKTNIEIVKLPESPVVKSVQDTPPAATPPPTPPRPAATELAPPTPAPFVASAETKSSVEPKPEKRGFLSSLNPVNLFRSKSKTPPPPTPLPPRKGENGMTVADARPAEASSPTPAPPVTPVTTTTSSAPPTSVVSPASATMQVPRYAYRSPAKPAAGNRKTAEPAFNQGIQAHRANRWNEAMQSYLQAAQADPAYFEAWHNLGLAALAARNNPQSLAAFETALALEPDSTEARYNFALALRDAGYWLDAANELEKLLASAPNETRAHLALGNLCAQKLRDPQRARLHYLKVLEVEPNHPQATNIRYWLANNPG